MAIFPPFFLGNIGQENIFYDILEREKLILGYKNKKFKKAKKIDIFAKGLIHGFGPKLAIFPPFFSGNICQKNVFYDILERKNAFLGYEKKRLQKDEKLTFFQRGYSMVLVQNWPFFHLIFLGNISQENRFHDILERKNAFVGYKNKKFKKWKT